MGNGGQTCQGVVLTRLKPALAWKHILVPKPCCLQQDTSGHRANSDLVSPAHGAIAVVGCAAFSITRDNFTSKEIVQVNKCYQQMSSGRDRATREDGSLPCSGDTAEEHPSKGNRKSTLRRKDKAEPNQDIMWTTRRGMVLCGKKGSAPGIFTGTLKWNLYKMLLRESEGKSITAIEEQRCETTRSNRAEGKW